MAGIQVDLADAAVPNGRMGKRERLHKESFRVQCAVDSFEQRLIPRDIEAARTEYRFNPFNA